MIILILLLGAICLPLLWMCLTSVEPNLILPERMERGEVYEIGETIVVMNHEDYYDMLCKSMEAETKHGEWIYGEHDVAMCDGYRCDRCGFFVPWDYEHKSIDFINDYHFCPYCGCRMKGADDEAD